MGGVAILLLSTLSLTDPGNDVLRVQVETSVQGTGPAGRMAALEKVKRDAVMEVVKGMTPTATEAAFSPLLDQASTYIESYKLIDQKQLGEYTRVEAEVLVRDKRLRRDLASFLLPLFPRTPRVTVALADGLAQEGLRQFVAGDAALAELVQAFIDSGIEVVDPAQVEKSCGDVEYRQRVRGEPALAVRFARENVADLGVVGEIVVAAEPADAGSNLCSTRARLTLRIIRADDARLFDAIQSEAVVQSVDPREAVALAISDACAKIREPMLVSSVLAMAGARKSDSIILTLEGIDDRDRWAGFCRDLQAMPGVQDLEELYFGGGRGRVRLKYDGPVAPLVDMLAAGEAGDLELEPTAVVERDMVLTVVR